MTVQPRVAAIGECMIEFRETAAGHFARAFGGDMLNAAVYLARLGVAADFATQVGDDAWSREMRRVWVSEGVGLALVREEVGASPGLYVIQVDEAGERRFSYWRDSSPARRLFDGPDPAYDEALLGYDALLLSGITLSLYGEAGRRRLFALLAAARARGSQVVVDANMRPRGWPDRDEARAVFRRAFEAASIVIASTEDLDHLFGADGAAELDRFQPGREIVSKHPDLTVEIGLDGETVTVRGTPAVRAVDTTAAGDSFAAAYLAARLRGEDPRAAAAAGHRLAGTVVMHPGAIIPRGAMPDTP